MAETEEHFEFHENADAPMPKLIHQAIHLLDKDGSTGIEGQFQHGVDVWDFNITKKEAQNASV
jgi:hypothetical protein